MRSEVGPAVLTVLGSGTLIPDGARSSAAHHVDTGPASVLLDCGSGTLHGMAEHGVDWGGLTHVVISHFHYDHVGDLPAILIAWKHGMDEPRSSPLTLVGPVGFRGYLDDWAEALRIPFLEQPFPIHIVELDPGDELRDPSSSFTLRCHPSVHTDVSRAYALEGAWGTIGYTGDTGPSDELARFLSGSRVLIAECSHPDPPPTHLHLTPDTLAHLANIARPELLVVTHVYPSQTPHEAVDGVLERYDGRAVPAQDGLVVRISHDDVAVDLPARRR